MKLADIFTSAGGHGRLSHTKLWANIAYAVATYAVALAAHRGTLTADMLLVYLGIVGASAAASKFIALRFPAKAENVES